MASVLLVDDEGVWLDLIRRALPQYEVSEAPTYEKAIDLLRSGVTYDVAVVDLNLLPSGDDMLGGELLKLIKEDYPSTRRIALTGWTPSAVKAVFDEYGVDDLLLKDKMRLSVVRQVVRAAVERTGGDVPDGLKDEKLTVWRSFRTWNDAMLQQLSQQEQTLKNDLREARRLGVATESSGSQLADLAAAKASLEKACSRFATMVNTVRSPADMEQVSEQFELLKSTFGA